MLTALASTAAKALSLARVQKQRVAEARALHLLARVLAAGRKAGADRQSRAIDACRAALSLGQALDLEPLVTRCRETLAELLDARLS
jgi:hypothetical protein